MTGDSIKSHMPADMRDKYDVTVVVTYRIEEAYDKVNRGKIDVANSLVVVDCLTNSVRETKNGGPPLTPDELVWCVDVFRRTLRMHGASDVVICEIKPTRQADVSDFNMALHRYLRKVADVDGGLGCSTQTRLEHLMGDGLHIRPDCYHILQQTFAHAILCKEVPSPTPFDELAPHFLRNGYRKEWPQMRDNRAQNLNHGWKW